MTTKPKSNIDAKIDEKLNPKPKRAKVKKAEVVSTAFVVDYQSYSSVTREADPDDKYDRDSTSTDHTVSGLSVSEDNRFDVVGAFVPDADNQKCFLVYVIYSTGDSFGHDENANIEFIQVFKTLEKAQDCALQIKNNAELYNKTHRSYEKADKSVLDALRSSLIKDPNDKKYSHDYSVCFKDEAGNIQRISASWNGYFESVSSVNVEEFSLKKKLKYKI